MTPVRKDALRRIVYICLGVLLMVLFPNTKGIGLYIGIFGLLVILYQVIRILLIGQLLLDDFIPPSKDKDDDALPNKVIYNTSMIVFICGLIGIIAEITPLENTIKGGQFFWFSAFTGLIIGGGLVFVLKGKFPTLLNERDRRFSVIFGFALGLFLLLPAIANIINIAFSAPNTDCMALPIAGKFREGTNNSSYHVRLKIHGNDEKFEITRETYDLISVGDTLNLCVKHGLIGYDFIDGFPTFYRK
jgi:hypothetical protein